MPAGSRLKPWLGLVVALGSELAMGSAGCADGRDRPIAVVGFRTDPSAAIPGAVMTSADRTTWNPPLPLGAEGEWITEIAAHEDRFVAIGLGGGVYESDLTATRWTRRRLHTSWLDAIHFPASVPGLGFLAGADAWFRSEDGGATWETLPPPGFYFEDFAFSTRDRGIGVEGYLVPASGKIWRTEDGGRGWTPVATTATGLRAVAATSKAGDEIWAAGDSGLVIASTNGGISWTDTSGPTPIGPTPDFTDVDFASPDAGWMVGTRGAARSYRGNGFPLAHRWTGGRAGDFVLQGVFAASRDEAWACGYRSFTDRGIVLHTANGGRDWDVVAETPGIFWYSIAGVRGAAPSVNEVRP